MLFRNIYDALSGEQREFLSKYLCGGLEEELPCHLDFTPLGSQY